MAAQKSYDDLDHAQRPRVERLCRLLLADLAEAQDVAQEVLMKLFRAQQARPATSTWNRWVARVTVNACRDRRRSAWWRRFRSEDTAFHEDDLVAPGAGPEEAALAAEVAETLGLSPGSAKRHLFRAVHRLRLALRGSP